MNMNDLYCTGQFSDSSFEFPQYETLTSIPRPMPKKPRHQQKQLSTDKWSIQAPQYPNDVTGSIDFNFFIYLGDAPAYSKKLKKLYLTTNHLLRLKFNWSSTFEPLFLRSAVVFSDDYHRTTPVQRCYAHMGPELPQNAGIRYDELRYVFRISDPANPYESKYNAEVNGILTTSTMLKAQEGEAWIEYKFFCQNSCPTGINRRATKMLFLVEDSMGVVVAKRSLQIQVCSNPKRDMEREEKRILLDSKKRKGKKKLQQQSPLPPLPPIKSSDSCDGDETVYSLNIDILGEDNYRAVLKYAYDVMAGQAIRSGKHQLLKPHMDAILIKEQLDD